MALSIALCTKFHEHYCLHWFRIYRVLLKLKCYLIVIVSLTSRKLKFLLKWPSVLGCILKGHHEESGHFVCDTAGYGGQRFAKIPPDEEDILEQ